MLLPALAFIYGLFIGSFLNVCIYRLPAGESIVTPPSHCPNCGRRLGARELLPVVSFLWQRGRCRGCGSAIAWRYTLVELATAILFAVLAWRFGWPDILWQAAFYAVLVVIFFIDLDHQLIPDQLVLLLLGITVLVLVLERGVPWGTALLGGLVGFGLFLLLAVLSSGGMGGGDIKLAAVLGLWFGWPQLLLVMFLSFLGGGLVGGALLLLKLKNRKDGIAFGPFLVLAAFIVSMWGNQLITWYLRIAGFI
ncbi:MAG TPA: prepilin peptidase [Oscillospiraceae bacterium]|nr:prepilin peptidase [Oscillospiraceae bacterium]